MIKKLIILIIVIIILISIYIYSTNYSTVTKKDVFHKKDIILHDFSNKKIKKHLTEEEFYNIKLPDSVLLYYFPEACPKITSSNILIQFNENGYDKYFVPEEKTLIVVNINHKWNKKPSGFIFWVSPVDFFKEIKNRDDNKVEDVAKEIEEVAKEKEVADEIENVAKEIEDSKEEKNKE